MGKKAFVDPVWTADLFPADALDDMLPIQALKDRMRPIVLSGEYQTCVACGQLVKLYPRSLNAAMIKTLSRMRSGVVSKRELTALAKGHDHQLMRWWDLVHKFTDASGLDWWRVTSRGKAFLADAIAVPRYALIYNNELYGWSREHWGLRDVVKNDFDLAEILQPFEIMEAAE